SSAPSNSFPFHQALWLGQGAFFLGAHLKIAVVGCGALGSYYGGQLCRARPERHFLLPSSYASVRRHGLPRPRQEGDLNARTRCARAPEDTGACGLILIGLNATANDQFPRLLPPLVQAHTAVLTLQNGLGNEERLAELFVPRQILGGLCFVCLNRV